MSPGARSTHDAVIVGSGVNSLTCAALLARAGWSVLVLERSDTLGGAIQTAELSLPGYLHDVFSGWHSAWLGGQAHAELAPQLAAHGLEYLNTELPAASVFPDGSAAFLLRSAEQTAAEFERHCPGDGETWKALMDASGPRERIARELTRREFGALSGAAFALGAWRQLGTSGLLELSAGMLESSRDWLCRTFGSEHVRGLLAPWVLHAGLGPDASGSAFATRLLTLAKQRVGSPVPRGGGARLVDALVGLIEQHGGRLETGHDVERVLVSRGGADGVRISGGAVALARRAVICNVTPTQLYGRLLANPGAELAAAAARYRYGLSDMQIHYALSEPARWNGDPRLDGTAVVHLSAGLDGVSRAVNEGQRGLLPADATLVVGQPLTLDPSRAPQGAGILWVQIMELPWRPRGDAGGTIDTGDGSWTPALRERYAERVHGRLATAIANLDAVTLARSALSPADLQAANINLLQGDPYSGAMALEQSLFWRPFPRGSRHRTPIERLWHIGASSHPGPGLTGASGYLVGKQLTAGRSRLVRPRRGA